MTAFCGLVGIWAYRRSQDFYRAPGGVFVTASIASYFTSDRPYQITYVLIMATILSWNTGAGCGCCRRMFLFWANCHGGFFMGFVVLGAYCAESLWQRFRGKPDPGERRLWLVTAVCVPCAFLNPNGFLTLYILLGLPAKRHDRYAVRMAEAALVAAYVSQSAAARRGSSAGLAARRTRLVGLDTARSLRGGLFSAIRNSNLLGLVAPMMLAVYMPWKTHLPSWTEWAVAAILIAARSPSPSPAGGPSSYAYAALEISRRCGGFSVGAPHHAADVQHLRKRRIPAVALLASRAHLHRRTQLEREGLRGLSADREVSARHTRELLDLYGIQVVVMNSFEANSGRPYVLPLALADPAEKEWKMVFADAGAVVFMRAPPPGVGRCRPPDLCQHGGAMPGNPGSRPGAAALRPQLGILPQCARRRAPAADEPVYG